jgi:hypothetical protein
MIVAGFTICIIFAIKYTLVSHLYYFTFFLFVYISVYFVQTAIGVKFLIGTSNVGEVSPIVFIYFIVHLVAMLIPGLMSKPYKQVRTNMISRNSCFFISLCVALYVIFVATVVDPSAFFSTREDQFSTERNPSYVMVMIFAAKISPYFVLIYIFHKALSVRNRAVYYFLFLVMLIFALVLSNPVNTPRYVSLASLSIFGLFIISSTGWIRYAALLVLMSPSIFILLLPISSIFRHGFNVDRIMEISESYRSLEFSSFQVLLDAFNVEANLQSSIYTLSGLFVVIPRILWRDKSEAFGDEIATNSGYIFTNTGITSSFNSFADYGWIGLAIFSLAIGYLMSKASLYKGMNIRNRKAFYSVLFFSMIPMLARGDLSTYMTAIYSFAIPYEVILFLSRINLKYGRPFFQESSSRCNTRQTGQRQHNAIAR